METALIAAPIALALLLTGFVVFVFSLRNRLAKAEEEARHSQQNLRYELYAKLHPLEEAFYHQHSGEEIVLYDGRKRVLPGDFTGEGSRAWDYAAHRFENGHGEGSFKIDGNEIAIYRTNTLGRYELHLHRYAIDGKERKELTADSSKQKRRLRLSCDVKRSAASHGLRFVFKGKESKEVLDEKDCLVFNPDWQPVSLYFNVPASEPTHLRIDSLHVTKAPDSVQIKNLVLFEKI